jgi:hypothetical protein
MGSAAVLLGVLLLTISAGPLFAQTAEPEPDPASPTAPAVPAAGLPGIYECQGISADGRAYRGAVIIQPDGNRFVLQWYVGPKLTAVGVGIRGDNVLAVSFFGAEAGGVVLYRIDGARLIGHWSAPITAGQVFEETLTRVADAPPPDAAPPASAPPKPRPSSPRLSGNTRGA